MNKKFLVLFFKKNTLLLITGYAPVGRDQASRASQDGDKRVRTDDLLLAKQALSQLSYAPSLLVPDP